jgi:hypothetical protein
MYSINKKIIAFFKAFEKLLNSKFDLLVLEYDSRVHLPLQIVPNCGIKFLGKSISAIFVLAYCLLFCLYLFQDLHLANRCS